MSTDRNRMRVTGESAGNIWVNDVHVFTPDGFALSRAYAEATFGILARLDDTGRSLAIAQVIAQAGDADALKFSGVRRLQVAVGHLDGTAASEDAVDLNNHCEDVSLVINTLYPGKKYCGTIKGESRGIAIEVLTQHGHGGETDWDFGNFSDQGNARTTGCTLNVVTFDDSPARVRLLSADMPKLIESDGRRYTVTKLNQGWFYPVFNFFKDLFRC